MSFLGLLNDLLGLRVPLLALFCAYIAWRQYCISRNRLRFDWYDKRFEVYQGLKDMLLFIFSNNTLTIEELRKFKISIVQSTFLFNESSNIDELLGNIYKKAITLKKLSDKLNDKNIPVGPKRDKLTNDQRECLEWFDEQTKIAEKLFSKYLKPTGKY